MGPEARGVLSATAPLRTGMRCTPIIAAANKTGTPLSIRRPSGRGGRNRQIEEKPCLKIAMR
jgi:hypothetical protein